LIKILAFMEIEGIKVDNKFLNTLSLKFEKKIEKIQKEIFKISKKRI
jgi:DNA polymerase-1